MKIIFVIAALFSTGFAHAITQNDDATHISKDTLFISRTNLIVPANAKSIDVFSGHIAGTWHTCKLNLVPDSTERVLKAGHILKVDHTERVKSGTIYPAGYAALVFFDHTVIKTMKCFAGEPLSDNHKVPKFGALETALANTFEIQTPPPAEIPAPKFCN